MIQRTLLVVAEQAQGGRGGTLRTRPASHSEASFPQTGDKGDWEAPGQLGKSIPDVDRPVSGKWPHIPLFSPGEDSAGVGR